MRRKIVYLICLMMLMTLGAKAENTKFLDTKLDTFKAAIINLEENLDSRECYEEAEYLSCYLSSQSEYFTADQKIRYISLTSICLDVMGKMDPRVKESKKIFDHVEIMPSYPGGKEEMQKYIKKNVKYPRKYKRKGIKGTVIVRVLITKAGNIIEADVIQSLHPDLDAEAVRVVSGIPYISPGRINGEIDDMYYKIPVKFE